MSDDIPSSPRFRPNPKRQLTLVLLALVGLGLGYGLGFVFKRPPAHLPVPNKQVMPAQPEQTSNNIAQQPTTKPARPTEQVRPAPMLPDTVGGDASAKPRAYEEALPKEIIVTMVPLAPAKQPAPEPEAEPMTRYAPSSERTKTEPAPKTAATPPIQTTTPKSKSPTPAWRKHAVMVKADGRPSIAIVIDDLGIDQSRSRRIMALPSPLSLSFLAYAKELDRQAGAGREAGHEIWLHVPMEPRSASVDPGPNVLLTGLPKEKLLAKLRWNLDQLSDYVGINNHMGSRFTADARGMRAIMGELKHRGLAFLDSVTSSRSAGHQAARETGVPFTLRNVFLDHENDLVAINLQLKRVEQLAKRQGHAIAIGHPREATLQALEPWLKTLDAKGFQLMPASMFLRLAQSQTVKSNQASATP